MTENQIVSKKSIGFRSFPKFNACLNNDVILKNETWNNEIDK